MPSDSQLRFRSEATMQLNIITSQQQLQFSYIQSNLNQSAKNSDPQLQIPILKDRIEFSDDARRPRDTEHGVERMHKGQQDQNSNPLFNFLKEILEKITGTQVNELKNAPPVSSIAVPSTDSQVQPLCRDEQLIYRRVHHHARWCAVFLCS